MKQPPLMMDELSLGKRALLTMLVAHPGWAVFEEMCMSACKRATEDVLKCDPIEEGYERKVLALQAKARERNEFSLLILGSITWHIEAAQQQTNEQEAKAPVNPILQTNKFVKDNRQ
jgi:hypothetical protein